MKASGKAKRAEASLAHNPLKKKGAGGEGNVGYKIHSMTIQGDLKHAYKAKTGIVGNGSASGESRQEAW